MKKLMIALAVVAMGVATNAASFTWTTKGRIYDGAGTSAAYASGETAYLMFTSIISQADLVESFIADASAAKATVTGGAVKSSVINNEARVSETSAFTSSVTEPQSAYYVIFANDKMYVSGTASASYDSLNPDAVNAIEFAAETTASKATFADTTATYAGAGWYQAAAVPEPTSGLLVLLGMAGLALKRKRT